nr:hypothetical protein [Euzebya rosea]
MKVEVRDLLAGGVTRVEPDRVAGGAVLIVEQALDVAHEREQVGLLLWRRLPPRFDQPARHQQGMPGDWRIRRRDRERRCVAGEVFAGRDGKERREV